MPTFAHYPVLQNRDSHINAIWQKQPLSVESFRNYGERWELSVTIS